MPSLCHAVLAVVYRHCVFIILVSKMALTRTCVTNNHQHQLTTTKIINIYIYIVFGLFSELIY